MMKNNLTLIGMPGAGKSTVGVILAKRLSFGFVDTDVLIQSRHSKPLQRILDESGYLNLRRVEEAEILKLYVDRHVIATGGSAVYSEAAMAHLKAMSTIVFLDLAYNEIVRRIKNFATRGIAKAEDQTFRQMFEERHLLYERYAEIRVDANRHSQDELAEQIAALYLGDA